MFEHLYSTSWLQFYTKSKYLADIFEFYYIFSFYIVFIANTAVFIFLYNIKSSNRSAIYVLDGTFS